MQGSLRLHAGVLFVGRQALTADVSTHDLDGRPLETRFSFRDVDAGRSSVDGLDVDADRRLWIADGAAGKVRCFTLFGVEVASVGDESSGQDARGALGQPVDLRVVGADDDMLLLVASGGDRRHALQVLLPSGGKGRSIAPLGDPEGRFRRIRGVDWRDGELAVVEAGARRVQVFEGSLAGRLVFRFAFQIPEELGEPEAVALAGGGRFLVVTRGDRSGLHLFDAAGRPLRCVAGDEREVGEGGVDQPCAVALDLAESDRRSRACVLDREGERVQVFSLDGRSFGSILGLGDG
ncbi:hypothetical protein N9Z54_09345 [Planctomycetota bacterium]|nr:hypothetical protein [Planctomycetota bacterium]